MCVLDNVADPVQPGLRAAGLRALHQHHTFIGGLGGYATLAQLSSALWPRQPFRQPDWADTSWPRRRGEIGPAANVEGVEKANGPGASNGSAAPANKASTTARASVSPAAAVNASASAARTAARVRAVRAASSDPAAKLPQPSSGQPWRQPQLAAPGRARMPPSCAAPRGLISVS